MRKRLLGRSIALPFWKRLRGCFCFYAPVSVMLYGPVPLCYMVMSVRSADGLLLLQPIMHAFCRCYCSVVIGMKKKGL